jgi:hypothetical protein
MAGGLVESVVAFAAGAILDFAVTASPYQRRFNIRAVGVILMIVGVVGAIFSLIGVVGTGARRHRTIVDDGQGNVEMTPTSREALMWSVLEGQQRVNGTG